MDQRNSVSASPTGTASKAGVPVASKHRFREDRPSVGILIDLALTRTSGGHVRFWQNIARAAASIDCGFDLSFHFQCDPADQNLRGGGERHTQLSRHVRIIELPPVFSTSRLRFLSQSPDHTDLSPHHRRLAQYLASYDVIHTTDAFYTYAQTAYRVIDPARQVLVNSIHTASPAYARIYSELAFRNLLGEGSLSRKVIEDWNWPAAVEKRMRGSLRRHLRACKHVWFSPIDDPESFENGTRPRNFDVLRRGIDWRTFSPDRRDRNRLDREFGLDAEDFVLAFAGRVDIGKEVMVAARATRALLDRGAKVKLLLAGIGDDAMAIRELLGPAVRSLGFVDQHRLGWILASSDAFVFPSRIETAANAVIEARAVGLPVVTTPQVGEMLIRENGIDGVIVDTQSPDAWADVLEGWIRDRDLARKMGAIANSVASETQPSWGDVLMEDLLPGWKRSRADTPPTGGDSRTPERTD